MGSFSWSFGVVDYIAPWLRNEAPTGGGIAPDALLSVDVLDDYSGVDLSTLDAYVDGSLVFSGPGTFLAPFNGPFSAITPTNVDGYDGYHLVFDYTVDFAIGSDHEVRVVCSDNYGNSMDSIWPFYIFNIVQSATQSLYEITFDVVFSGPMNENTALVSPANYVFDEGAYTRKVEVITSDTVRLWTELVYGETTYTLTISNVEDEHEAAIPIGHNTVPISPFLSGADFANTNGMVRTWRESQLVHGDTYRAYLAGERGIDVFRKVSGTTYDRWAQVFDAYGISAMHVANYPAALNIPDAGSPYLCGQVPAVSGFASPDTEIQFTIYDDISAIEIPDMAIYLNGNIIFRGSYGGWHNSYNGVIEIERHSLDITLYPPSDFIIGSLVVVRVVAADLLGNRLDTEYSFTIASPISAGFGISAFGWSPFGGA